MNVPDVSLLLHMTYPKQELDVNDYKNLPSHIKRVVTVMHDEDHYSVMEIIVTEKIVRVLDGLATHFLTGKIMW